MPAEEAVAKKGTWYLKGAGTNINTNSDHVHHQAIFLLLYVCVFLSLSLSVPYYVNSEPFTQGANINID